MSEVKQEGDFKIKSKPKKPKNLGQENSITKVDIPKIDAESQGKVIPDVIKVDLTEDRTISESVTEEVVEDSSYEESLNVIQEIVEDEIKENVENLEEQLDNALTNNEETGAKLPENIEKLVAFMQETGGNINDYVRLNTDYSSIDNNTLLREYYKKTKPHLDSEDINIIMEDFSYDEDLDDERNIRKAKIAYKEEVAKARNFLEETKSKYYDEIKLRPGVTQDQQKAMDFFNRYKEDQEAATKRHSNFVQETNNLLNDNFKGFDFNVGEKKFRYGIKNAKNVAEAQSDISNFIGKFLGKDGSIKDTVGYHKALYAARNADTIAQHFYEQGKADAVKEVVAKSKNISTEPRQNASGNVFINGLKVKAISGLDSSKLKIKTKKFN
jgi:hypothetical protein